MTCACGPKYHEKGCVILVKPSPKDAAFPYELVSKNKKAVLRFQTREQMDRFSMEHERAYNPCP